MGSLARSHRRPPAAVRFARPPANGRVAVARTSLCHTEPPDQLSRPSRSFSELPARRAKIPAPTGPIRQPVGEICADMIGAGANRTVVPFPSTSSGLVMPIPAANVMFSLRGCWPGRMAGIVPMARVMTATSRRRRLCRPGSRTVDISAASLRCRHDRYVTTSAGIAA